jgi:hypothetical protein
MSNQEMIFQDGCRTATIYSKTFGGFRIAMNDWYFELLDEKSAETYEQAKELAEAWVRYDNKKIK